jgi:arylsulfatase A-like enzyme
VHRTDVIVRSTGHLVLWTAGHYALEWLFFATKPSIVSAAPAIDQLLLLLASPLTALLALVPLQLLLATIDTLRRDARSFWLAAILPAASLTVLGVIAVDNFTKTMLGVGIVSTSGFTAAAYGLAVLAAAAWLLRREARALAELRNVRPLLAGATVVVLAALTGQLCTSVSGRRDLQGSPQPGKRVEAASAPNILIIGIDGVGADHSSAYGYHRRTTPTLERLAARGLLFENAFSNASRTYGSLITLLTGKLPTETRTLAPPSYLTGRDSVEHLPGILREAGYTTALLGMRHYADADDWNMKGAFDENNGRKGSSGASSADRTGRGERLARHRRDLHERISDRLLHIARIEPMHDEFAFLKRGNRGVFFSDDRRLRFAGDFIRSRREPWLLHVHLLDTHCCGETGRAPVPWPDRNPNPAYDDYDDSYFYADQNIARILSILEATGQLDRTMIVVYSDHSRAWHTLSRLPLIIVPPGGSAPQRIAANVQLLDVAPTILEAVGLPRPPWMKGRSLLAHERLDPRAPIFSLIWVPESGSDRPSGAESVEAGPTGDDAAIAGLVICDRSIELDTARRTIRERAVEGHTQPCGDGPLGEPTSALLARHLRANGYPAGEPDEWKAAETR